MIYGRYAYLHGHRREGEEAITCARRGWGGGQRAEPIDKVDDAAYNNVSKVVVPRRWWSMKWHST